MGLDEETRIYARHTAEAERSAWSVERNIRWLDIDAARAHATPHVLRQLREAALIQSAQPVKISRLLQLLWDDVDATAALSIMLHESFRHFHALRTYLEVVGFRPAITDGEIIENRRADARTALDPRRSIEHLVELMLAEHLGSYFFHRRAEEAQEPVLRELLTLISADEARHAQCVCDLIAPRIANDHSLRLRVLHAAAHHHEADERVVGDFSVVMPSDPIAIRTFAKKLEGLCGLQVTEHLRVAL